MADATDRRLRGAALAVFLGTCALVAVAVLLDRQAQDELPDDGLVLSGSVMAVTGVLLAWARPRSSIGWLLQATALAGATCNAGQVYAQRALVVGDVPLPAAQWVLMLVTPLWMWALCVPVTFLLARYPSGRLGSPFARRLDRATLAGLVLLTAGYAMSPQSVTDIAPDHLPPLLLPELARGILLGLGALLFLPSLLATVVHAFVRMLRAGRPERQQLALLFSTAVLATALVWVDVPYLGTLAYPLIPVAVVVGVLRYDLLGIDVVVRRTLLYAALTAIVLGVFVAVTAALTAVVPRGRAPEVVAASLVAVILGPARDRLQRLVDRLVYGDRRDPWEALQRLSTPVGGVPDDELLAGVVVALAATLRVPGVAVFRADGSTAAATGHVPADAAPTPLRVGGTAVGELAVAPRRGEDRLGEADLRLLRSVAPLVAVVLRAVDLADLLRAERGRVLDAAQAERARLRRDLHDGLGPSLTGVGMGLEALQSRLGPDPLVDRLREEVRASVEEVRRILDDLRPAALDELGLVGALERRATQLAPGLRVRVTGPDRPLEVAPEAEVAAYRIADEALTNVVRHAGATSCEVDVHLDGVLRVAVTDDGTGVPAQREGGLGLPSMRARAEQLGGRFTVEQTGSGTRVVAELPA